jgi:hypothetical protein
MTDQGREYEMDGWMSLEAEDEEEDARELAKEAFQKAIDAGNIGAYYGLGSLVEDGTQKVEYLRKATDAGRLDAMWELYMVSENKTEQYAVVSIVVDNGLIADAKEELDLTADEMTPDEIEKGNKLKTEILNRIESSGNSLGTGANPYF